MVTKYILITGVLLSCITAYSAKKKQYLSATESDNIYREAQRKNQSSNFDEALKLFEKYLETTRFTEKNENRLYWSLDEVGRIHLRVKRDPVAASKFLKRYEKDLRLSESQQDSISEWLAACEDWKAEKKKPGKIKNPETLFKIGKRYFDKAEKLKSYPRDSKGSANYVIAGTYLRSLIVNHDDFPKISEALFMMGVVKANAVRDTDYWSENFYLKEAIRRNPHSALAEKAWKSLDDEVRFAYTGSGGDHTPPSVKRMLLNFKRLATPPKKKKKKAL